MVRNITEEEFRIWASSAPPVVVATLYTLSKYHEKYRLTDWCMKWLIEQGFDKLDLKKFDKNFADFYDDMLKQEDL